MSELRGESSAPEMSAVNGVSDVLQTGVGGRRRAREAQEGPVVDAARPMARVQGPAPRPIPSHVPGLMSMPSLHGQLGLIGINHQRLFHQYLNNSPMIPVRVLRDIEERRRLFVEGCKAREAAFDANPAEMDSDAVAFALAVTAAEAGSPLAD
ncbi:EP300-interacting inhibitor of differentiation 2B [Erethizon dorsatum]